MKLPSHGCFTFSVLQQRFQELSQFQEIQFLGGSQGDVNKWLARLIEHKKKIVRQVRKREVIPIERIVEAFLMIVSFASYRGIDVQEVITTGYPGFCIYCGGKPCNCTKPGITRPLSRLKTPGMPNSIITLARFQKQDWQVYPNNRSFESQLTRALHLSEEFDEWTIEFLRDSPLEKLFEEVADSLERLMSLMSTFKIKLGREIAKFVNSRLI